REEETGRRAKEMLFSIQNSRKAREGGLAGLLNPRIMGEKKSAEQRLRAAVEGDPKLKEYAGAWNKIAAAQKITGEHARKYNLYEGGAGFQSDLFSIARTLARAADERPKPNPQRLREFRESALESLKFQLFSEEPIYDDFETLKLANSLTYLAEQFGADDPLVQKVLDGKAPEDRAAELVNGTKVKDVA